MAAAGVLAGGTADLARRGARPGRDARWARAGSRSRAVSAPSALRDARRSPTSHLPASLAGAARIGGARARRRRALRATRDALDLSTLLLRERRGARCADSARASKPPSPSQLDDPAPALDLLDRYLGSARRRRSLHEENAAALPLGAARSSASANSAPALRRTRRCPVLGKKKDGWRADIERLHVLHDPALAEEERAARLAILEAELPESVREARDAATAASSLRTR